MSSSINVNQNLPVFNDLPQAYIEPNHDGFVDTGILVELAIPFNINRRRKKTLSAVPNPVPDGGGILPTNRTPLFGILIDPFVNHDLSGDYSPLCFPDPNWAANNTQLTIHPYGTEHPLVRLAPTFVGWTGGIDYLITVNSTALVQGELSFIRAKYIAGGPFSWKNVQLENEEPDNNQIMNLSSEKRAVKFVGYSEPTDFINMMQYWLVRTGRPYTNTKPMNLLRNWLFIRANTDITTLSANGGTLAFKIYMKPASDFQWIHPSIPIRPDRHRVLSVVDKLFPFPVINSYVVSQRPFASSSSNRPLVIDNTSYESSFTVPETGSNTNNYPTGVTGFVDVHKFNDAAYPEWTAITGVQIAWATPYAKLAISVRISGTYVLIREVDINDLVYGTVLLDVGFRDDLNNSTPPPYFYP